MSYETDRWPIIKAKWFTPVRGSRRAVRLVVIHTMEAPELEQTAENVALWFSSLSSSRKASAHVCIDEDSVVQCVMDNDVAYAAPGANHDGIQLELAGVARQTLAQWLDEYSVSMLARAADVTAQYCLKYNLPVKKLSNTELRAGHKGVIGHVQASQVYKKSSHTDPGENFPWEIFLALATGYYKARKR